MELDNFFDLLEYPELFQNALTPKSCGGGDEFKLLALIGDRVLNLIILDLLVNEETIPIITTGILTPLLSSLTEQSYFMSIAKNLGVSDFMTPIDETYQLSDKELCETLEALFGATYQAHGLTACQKVLLNLKKQFNYFNPDIKSILNTDLKFINQNPKGRLLELFQQNKTPMPDILTKRIGGKDHLPMFQAKIMTSFNNKKYNAISDVFIQKAQAEKDVALKLLELILKNETK